jgi:hypothetical protein
MTPAGVAGKRYAITPCTELVAKSARAGRPEPGPACANGQAAYLPHATASLTWHAPALSTVVPSLLRMWCSDATSPCCAMLPGPAPAAACCCHVQGIVHWLQVLRKAARRAGHSSPVGHCRAHSMPYACWQDAQGRPCVPHALPPLPCPACSSQHRTWCASKPLSRCLNRCCYCCCCCCCCCSSCCSMRQSVPHRYWIR